MVASACHSCNVYPRIGMIKYYSQLGELLDEKFGEQHSSSRPHWPKSSCSILEHLPGLPCFWNLSPNSLGNCIWGRTNDFEVLDWKVVKSRSDPVVKCCVPVQKLAWVIHIEDGTECWSVWLSLIFTSRVNLLHFPIVKIWNWVHILALP